MLWSWVFEVILPRTAAFERYCVADHRDVLCYAAGALAGAVFWRWWYGEAGEGHAEPGAPGR